MFAKLGGSYCVVLRPNTLGMATFTPRDVPPITRGIVLGPWSPPNPPVDYTFRLRVTRVVVACFVAAYKYVLDFAMPLKPVVICCTPRTVR